MFWGGVAAGLLGGLVLGAFVVLAAALRGEDLWAAVKLPAYPLFAGRSLAPGFDAGPVLAALAVHFAIAIGWAVPFAVLAFGLSRPLTVMIGLLWGLGVWLAMFHLVLPAAGAALGPPERVALEHLVYGATMALGFLPFQRPGRAWGHEDGPVRAVPA